MTDKTKKVIAREGLIVIGFIVCAVIVDIVIRTTTMTSGFWSDGSPMTPHLDYGKISEYIRQSHLTFFVLFMIYVFTRFIIWAMRTLRGGENFTKEEKQLADKILLLIEKNELEQSISVMRDLIGRWETRWGANDKRVIDMKKACVEGFITNLYGKGSVAMNKKDFLTTKACLAKVQEIIMDSPEIFNIDKKLMGQVLIDLMNEFKDKGKQVPTDEFKLLRATYKKKTAEIFTDKTASGAMAMLIDTYLLPPFCDAMENE